jgi:hypothetical protein
VVVGAVVTVALGVAAVAVFAVVQLTGDDGTGTAQLQVVDADGAVDHDYVIPAGTQDRRLRGEQIEIMPAELDVKVGESIRITNDDDAGAFVGIFYVGAGEVVSMRFTTPGTLSGACDLTPDGEFTIEVAPV